jgi:tRNA dimethylallyltransferase
VTGIINSALLSNTSPKTVIIIAGPTAAGKTAVAIQLAQHYKTEIISADSRQCYKELNIGVARPTQEELGLVPHHFIASHSIQEEVTAATFEQFAIAKTNELFEQHDTVVMVGGTGLYIKVFCEGLDDIPSIDPEVRERVISNYETKGLQWLQDEIKQKDPGFYQSGEINNPQRMMRALEVRESTGRSVLDFRKGVKVKRDFTIIKTALELPKAELHRNIHARVDRMMDAGLLAEVKSLLPFKNLNALQTVGYRELFSHLDGRISLEDAVRQIKTSTRQYAKRQMTWFRKDKEFTWFSSSQIADLIGFSQSR